MSAWTSSTLAGPKGRVAPGVPNTDGQSCAAIALSSALRETLPDFSHEQAVRFVAAAREAFPATRNPFVLMEDLALPDFVISARRWYGCGCAPVDAQQIGITYLRPATTPTNRPIHVQALCSGLSHPHPVRCDTCHALTVTSQCFDGVPEYVALDTPRHHHTPAGDIQEDAAFPGVYHECRRPVYFNGVAYRTTAIICQTPGHFVTAIPRGRTFLVVDDGKPVRAARRDELPSLFQATMVTFLARLHSQRAPRVSFAPTTLAPTTTTPPVADSAAATPTAGPSTTDVVMDTDPTDTAAAATVSTNEPNAQQSAPASPLRKRVASLTTFDSESPRHRPRPEGPPLPAMRQTTLNLTRRCHVLPRAPGNGPATPSLQQRLTVASWNVAGFTANKVADLTHFLHTHKVDVLCMQELRWGTERSPLSIQGYSATTLPRTSRGGGVALYVRASLPHKPLRPLNVLGASEQVYVQLELGRNKILVGSVYLPPPAQVDPGLFAHALRLQLPTIIGGDFNSHHEWWSQGVPNGAGTRLQEELEEAGLDISGLDLLLATFPRSQGRPDLLLSTQVTECRTWVAEVHVSDHFPLLTTYDLAWEYTSPPHDCRLRHQFASADWASFRRTVDQHLDPHLERRLSQIRTTKTPAARIHLIEAGTRHLQSILLVAAAAIPKSIRDHGTPPFWNDVCQAADDICCQRFARYQADSSDAHWTDYLHAKHARLATLMAQRRLLFDKRVSTLDPARAADWNLVKSRDRHVDFRGAIIDGVSNLTAKANLFARRFSPPTPTATLRVPRHEATPRVTLPELEAALRKTQRGKAPGPDGIHPEFLRDGLDRRGRMFLLSVIDASIFTGYLPTAWKHAHWLPILKPSKPADDSGSYRPISLTSVISKVAERIMDSRIRADPACQIDPRQHAFRRGHRTEDALARLVDTANRAWNATYETRYATPAGKPYQLHRSGRASATLLDLTSAFDNLRHDRLHALLRQHGFPPYIVRWVMSFLLGRTAQVILQGAPSQVRRLTRGAPQGTVLGPLLFLLYIDPLVEQIRTVDHVDPILFADDITVLAVGRTAAECASTTQQAVDLIMAWCDANGMPLAPAKTKALLFTPSTNSDETNAGIKVGPIHVPITRTADPACKLLGVYLDPGLSFGRHQTLVRARATHQLRLLRHAVTQMGPSTHTLRTFGKALIESRLFYAVGGWGAQISPYEHNQLECTQRDMARAVTGIAAQAPPAGTLLEANLVPASVVTRTQVAALIERWRRLPATDLRYTIIQRPLPTRPTGAGRRPFFPHPWTEAMSLIDQVLTERSVPLQHLRLPVLANRRTPPQCTAAAAMVFVYPAAVGAPDTLPEKGSVAGDLLRTELNHASWDDLMGRHGPFEAEIWTDGGVLHAEFPDCISASAGHLYLGKSAQPHDTFAASAGRLACSYTAEFVALTGSIYRFAPSIPDNSRVLIAIDSQSLLQALAKGPLLTHEDFEDQLWAELLVLARRGCTVVLQFFYSHVNFPPRNKTVDEAVTSLLDDPLLNHDAPAIWLTDLIRAVHRYLYCRWLDNAHDARTDLCGKTRAPLREMVAWSRADQTLFSRSRTDTLLEFGSYRLRLGLTSSPACRWCGLHPPTAPPQPVLPVSTIACASLSPTHTIQVPPIEPTAAPDGPAPTLTPTPPPNNQPPTPTPANTPAAPRPPPPANRPAAPASAPSYPCPLCEATYGYATSLRRHLDRSHPNDPRPANSTNYLCECGAQFPSGKSRAVHLRACPLRLALAAVAPPPAPPPPPLRSAESARHLLACPGLHALRLHHNILPKDAPPPLTEALTDHRWVDFLRAALAMVAPPASAPEGPPLAL